MKTIIAGSRDIVDPKLVGRAINNSKFYISEVVSGTARGVDQLGEQWAGLHDIPITRFKPDWDGLGKAATFVRNVSMAEYADVLIAVWDGSSNGTKHMIECMQKLGKPVEVYNINTPETR